jgi:hypothetical protein
MVFIIQELHLVVSRGRNMAHESSQIEFSPLRLCYAGSGGYPTHCLVSLLGKPYESED